MCTIRRAAGGDQAGVDDGAWLVGASAADNRSSATFAGGGGGTGSGGGTLVVVRSVTARPDQSGTLVVAELMAEGGPASKSTRMAG